LEPVDHVVADLGGDAGASRDVADARFFRAGRRGRSEAERETATQQYFLQFVSHCHYSLFVVAFPSQVRKASLSVFSNFRFCLEIGSAAAGGWGFPSGPSADRELSARRRSPARTDPRTPVC